MVIIALPSFMFFEIFFQQDSWIHWSPPPPPKDFPIMITILLNLVFEGEKKKEREGSKDYFFISLLLKKERKGEKKI